VHDLGRARRFLPGPRLVSVLVGGAAAILVLYPVVFLVQASLSTGDPQARPPEAYGLDNFTDLPRYGHIFANTVIVAVAAGHHKKAMFTLQERIEMAREVA